MENCKTCSKNKLCFAMDEHECYGYQQAVGVQEQPAPKLNWTDSIADLVVQDMMARKAEGIRRYGVPLQAFNGRKALIDAYHEAIDLCMYLRQEIQERGL